MDNELCREVEARCNNCLARLNRGELATGNLKLCRSCRFEYSSANSTAHLQIGVGGIDDCVNFHFCDVLPDDGKWHC
jgi:hypothetical protein